MKKEWKLDLLGRLEGIDEIEQYEPDPYLDPNSDEVFYIIGIDHKGNGFFIDTPNIWEGFFENQTLDDNGFEIPEDLCAGVWKIQYKYIPLKDWETGYVDDWEFNVKGEPELLYEYGEVGENEENL